MRNDKNQQCWLARCHKGTYPQKITRYVALPVTESGPPPLPLPLIALPQHDETLSLSEAKLVCVVCFVVKHCINSSVVQDSQLLLDTYTTINPDCYVCNRRLLVRVSNILAVLIKIEILLHYLYIFKFYDTFIYQKEFNSLNK